MSIRSQRNPTGSASQAVEETKNKSKDEKRMRILRMRIKEIARQVGEFAETKLMGREGCVTIIDNQIVLFVENVPGHLATGIRFDFDLPNMLRIAATNIINRMVFDLSPEEVSALVTSTIPTKQVFIQDKNSRWHTQLGS